MDDVARATTRDAARPSGDARSDQFARAFDQERLDKAYRLARVVLSGRDDDAQDAVHDAAVRAWLHWSELRDQSAFDTWFDRILVNACRDRLRKARRLRPVTIIAGESAYSAADDPLGVLEEAFDQLSSEHRVVIALRYVEDLPLEEIAERTGTRLGTVKSRLHYALRAMRSSYDASRREVDNA